MQKMLPDETTATGNQTHFKSYKCNEIWLFCCTSWGHIDTENSIYLFLNVENQFFTLGRHDWKSGRHQWCTARGSYFVVGCHLVTLFFFSFHRTISSHPSSHPSATLSLSLSHPSPRCLSLSDPFFMLQSIFSPPFAMVYCNLSPSPSHSVSALRDSLSLSLSLPFPVSLCHIIYSSHPCCSRSLLSLSWAIHLSLHFSPIKHHPSINLLSIPLFKVIAWSLSLSLPLLLSPLCSNCLCDPWYMPLSLKKT